MASSQLATAIYSDFLPDTRLVLIMLGDSTLADDCCYYSVNHLAHLTGLTAEAVIEILMKLHMDGYVWLYRDPRENLDADLKSKINEQKIEKERRIL